MTLSEFLYRLRIAFFGQPRETYGFAPGRLGFRIEPLGGIDEMSWKAWYKKDGKVARFEIHLLRPAASGGPAVAGLRPRAPVGKIIADPTSEADVFLADLARIFDASRKPDLGERHEELAFGFEFLGDRRSRQRDGSFHSTPPGGWIVLKCFILDEDKDGEVFLNLNPKGGLAEFGSKDSAYADVVLAALARVV